MNTLMFIMPQGEMRHPHGSRELYVVHARDDDGDKLDRIMALKDRYNNAGVNVAVLVGQGKEFCHCKGCRRVDLMMSAKLAKHEDRMTAFNSCMSKLALIGG